MAKASVKKGYARLANELGREFARRDFNETQYAILFATIPATYGYKGRESFPYTRAAMALATGRDVSHVGRAVTALVDARVLLLEDGQLGINPVIDEWQIAIKKGAENARDGERKTPESTGVKRPESGRKTPEKRAENARPSHLKPADGAILAAPKEIKESIKQTPLTPQGAPRTLYGLAAIASGVDWMDGELEKFLTLFGVKRIESLNAIQGQTTVDEAKAFLVMTDEYRAKGWAYLEARKADPNTPPPPKGFTISTLVGYLQDPSKYPAPPAPKVAPMRQREERPEWLAHLVRNRPTGTTAEFMDALSTAAKYYTLQGFTDVGHNTVLDWAEATTPMDAAKRLHSTLSAQVNARKQAANG